jgi:S-formylglutathione hydrolase FrmB
MHLRTIVPATLTSSQPLPVVYLLHGAGVDYRDWSNNSNIASFAAKNIILVMPDEAGAYYINEATGNNRRYEDYFINEVIPALHRTVPNATTARSQTAIVGISRGGFGAAVLGLKHPQLFSFVGDLSGAIDFPERPFRLRAPIDSLGVRKVFGPPNGPTRQANDPFLLLAQTSAQPMPYFFITCGNRDTLFDANQRFATAVAAHHLTYEFHILQGGHNWGTWNAELPELESALFAHFNQTQGTAQ